MRTVIIRLYISTVAKRRYTPTRTGNRRPGHNLVDHGADLVIGSHPHVLQPMETYNGVNIVYSLGNFIFGGNNYPENRTLIYNQTLTITQDAATGGFTVANTDVTLIPCYVYTGESNNYQPGRH